MGPKIALAALAAGAIIYVMYLLFRKNHSSIDSRLKMTTRDLVCDKWHNSNTSLAFWREEFWLVFIQAPFHFFSTKSKLIVWRSRDSENWTPVRQFSIPGVDIRDPKLSVINDQLFLYCYKSIGMNPQPYMTAFASTANGITWTDMSNIESFPGWLFWTPKTRDNQTWYATAHRIGEGKTALFSTRNGIDFAKVSIVHDGVHDSVDEVVDESDFAFDADGSMISTQRLEFSDCLLGDRRAGTNLTTAKFPYVDWAELGKDDSTRLDGPSIFAYHDYIYAAGRHHVSTLGWINQKTSIFTRKRTSIYLVTPQGLIHLSDLPSSGDTAYCGSVIHQENVYISYYTSNIRRDWPWIVGMWKKSAVRLARIELDSLEKLAELKQKDQKKINGPDRIPFPFIIQKKD
jgi:hypothetical protein